ncbi:sensor histidine kinase [Candidatus Clostridium radicumherbarum]|uniref:Sensor histidine kinase n=1 Tax=Candidatus Clostridium radicumherbarum TaxID=3381662 RepID=A0ABW8TNE6_9CLOT
MKHIIRKSIKARLEESIKFRLIVIISLSLAVPLAIITLLSFTRSSDSMESEIINSNSRSIVWTGKYIDNTITQLNDLLLNFLIDPNVSKNMNKIDDSNYLTQVDSKNYILSKMFSLIYSNKNFNGLLFFNESKSQLFYLSDGVYNYTSDYKLMDEIWYSSSKQNALNTIITNNNFIPDNLKDTFNVKDKNFFVYRRLSKFANDFQGVIFLNVKWKQMDDILNILKTEDESNILITDTEGKVIYNPFGAKEDNPQIKEAVDLINQNKTSGNSYIKTKDYSIFYYRISNDSLIALKIIPNSFIVKGARDTLNISILIMVISLIICILISIAIAHGTTSPIRSLSKSMKNINDIYSVNFKPTGRKDEIGILEQSYSIMIEKIRNLIDSDYKVKMEKRNAQFKALQAQINPHFMNNSLQLIGGIAISKNVPEIYTLIKAISNMLLYSIKVKEDLVTIKQEILHLKDYLLIQQMRFTDRIDIELNIEEGLNDYLLPKLSLQPIIENSFKHGLEKKAGIWKLSVQAIKSEKDIMIIVEDNGLGIEEKRIEEIDKLLQNNINNVLEIEGSMGLKNVDARLKLYFGNDYGIKLYSEKDKGTKITMIFKALKEGEE